MGRGIGEMLKKHGPMRDVALFKVNNNNNNNNNNNLRLVL